MAKMTRPDLFYVKPEVGESNSELLDKTTPKKNAKMLKNEVPSLLKHMGRMITPV